MLEAQGLTRRYGGLIAVDNVSLSIRPGEVRSIIGPNGAGKTTLFNLITGAVPASAGIVRFKGKDLTGRSPQEIFRTGVARSFQVSHLFGNLSVRDNVELMAFGRAARSGVPFSRLVVPRATARERADAALRRVGIADRGTQASGTLSHGERRLVEIAMVLAGDPELVLLDEPTAGMSPDETCRIADLIRTLAPQITVVLVEHDMGVVMGISDRITVLHRGAVIAEGEPAEIRANPKVQEVYFGGRRR